ncbi:hypothetical protein SRHO_G00180480 [Serrasalmus rhombeus]
MDSTKLKCLGEVSMNRTWRRPSLKQEGYKAHPRSSQLQAERPFQVTEGKPSNAASLNDQVEVSRGSEKGVNFCDVLV